MRVLISGLWAAEQPSGICRTVVNLIKSLNQASPGTQITLAIGAWQRRYFDERLGLGALNAEVIEVNIPNRSIARNVWYLSGLPRLARAVNARIVHLAFPAPILRRSFSCPVVVTLHDLYPYDRPENFGRPRVYFNRMTLERALRASDAVICVSNFTLKRLQECFPGVGQTKGVCIPNPVELAPHVASAERIIASPYFLAVAQHRANKNLGLVLESFFHCKVLRIIPAETRLAIVGSNGPETAQLRALVAHLALEHDVLFLSNRSDAEMAALYRDCELFLSLADVEGCDLPVGEALLCGARVVVSDIPPHREIARGHCEYVNLNREAATRSVLAAIATASRKPRPPRDAVSHLSPATIGGRYIAAYQAALQTAHLRSQDLGDHSAVLRFKTK